MTNPEVVVSIKLRALAERTAQVLAELHLLQLHLLGRRIRTGYA